MDKIEFTLNDTDEKVLFFVLEQTMIGGISYLLVTDSEEDDAEAYILRDMSQSNQTVAEIAAEEALYEIVEETEELEAVSKVFSQMMEDVDIIL